MQQANPETIIAQRAQSTSVIDRQGYWFSLGSGQLALAAVAIVQLVAVPVQVHAVGVEGFGVVSLATTWLGFAAMGAGWLTSGGTRRLGETSARGQWIEYASARLAIRWGLVVYGVMLAVIFGLGGWTVSASLPTQFQARWLETLLWLSLSAFLQYEQAGWTVILTAATRQHVCNLASIIQNGVFLAVLWWLLVYRDGSLPEIFQALAVGLMASRLVLAVGGRSIHANTERGSLGAGFYGLVTRRGMGYTAYGGLTQLQNMDVLLLGWLGGAQAAGLFSLLWRIPTLIVQVLWRVPAYLEPYIIQADAAGDRERVNVLYRQGVGLFYVAALAASIGYGALGKWFLDLWLGAGQAPDRLWEYWLAGGAAFWLVAIRWPSSFLHALARLRPLVIMLVAETGLRALLIIGTFDWLGYAAPLLAINLVIGGGLFWVYRAIGRKQTSWAAH
ncbi:MAG: hypothetical protein U0236_00255 [Nitrospira sp.]